MVPVKKQLKRPAAAAAGASSSSSPPAAASAPTSAAASTSPSSAAGDPADEGDEDYLNKRARNNDAVKRSRAKAKAKITETHDRVTILKKENQSLEGKIKSLSDQLTFLKDIFIAHAGSAHGMSVKDLDIDSILNEGSGGSSSAGAGASSSSKDQPGGGELT